MKEKVLNPTGFITELTKTLVTCEFPRMLGEKAGIVFRENFGIKNLKLMVYDKNSDSYRDFTKDCIYPEKENISDEHLKLLKNIKGKNFSKFICNDKILNFEDSENMSKAANLLKPENNKFLYPICRSNDPKCLIELNFDKLSVKLTDKILNLFYSGFLQISSAMLNELAKENITKMCDFYSAMKDIAKIAENQYEQAYLLPQTGEIIDRFISTHLIYVFIKDNNEFKLFWPKACKEKSIIDLLKKSGEKGEVLISEDRRTAIFPLKGEDGIIGAIAAYSNFGILTPEETDYLTGLTKQSEITLKRAAKYSEMLKHATLDALTGLNNRRQMELRLKQAVSVAERKGEDLCCLMADVDYFKKINDTYGHAAGDCVLRTLAEVITSSLREYDVACRYGGEEFLIILPGTSLDEAISAAHRLLLTVRKTKADISEVCDEVKEISITVSIGVNSYKKGNSAEELCSGADKALYEAKAGGRNRVVAFVDNERQGEFNNA